MSLSHYVEGVLMQTQLLGHFVIVNCAVTFSEAFLEMLDIFVAQEHTCFLQSIFQLLLVYFASVS